MVVSKEIAVMKLVIDLIKVDNKIHNNEISLIQHLISHLHLSESQYDVCHRISFREAIESLQQLDKEERNSIIKLIEKTISADDSIDTRERIILAATRLLLNDSTLHRAKIISTESKKINQYDNQLLYLEKFSHPTLIKDLDDDYLLYKRQLDELGIDLFFLPRIIQHIIHSHPYINQAINILFPTYTYTHNTDVQSIIKDCTLPEFSTYIWQQMQLSAKDMPFEAFFMLKMQDYTIREKHVTDFLCIQCSETPADDIRIIIKNLLLDLPINTMQYEGGYRTFFEMICEKSKQDFYLLLQEERFFLTGNLIIPLNIKGAERKTLFTLFLLYGASGISNETFASISSQSPLGKEAIIIYRYFAKEKAYAKVIEQLDSGKEPDIILNLRDIRKRNSHIGYIKKAFTQILQLKNPHLYYPNNIKGEHCYHITLAPHCILGQHFTHSSATPLTKTFFD